MKTSLKYVLLIITGLLSQNHAQVVGNRGDTTDYAFNPQNYNFVDCKLIKLSLCMVSSS